MDTYFDRSFIECIDFLDGRKRKKKFQKKSDRLMLNELDQMTKEDEESFTEKLEREAEEIEALRKWLIKAHPAETQDFITATHKKLREYYEKYK